MAIGQDKAKIVTFVPKEIKKKINLHAFQTNKSASNTTKYLLEKWLDSYKQQNHL